MPGGALLAALAVASSIATAHEGAEVPPPCAADKLQATSGHDSCEVDTRGSQSTMLIQFGVKHRKTQPEETTEGVKKAEPLGRESALAKIFERARMLSEESGQPMEYLMDVDYLHDANNPLDNYGQESKKAQRSRKEDGSSKDGSSPGSSSTEKDTEPSEPPRPHDELIPQRDGSKDRVFVQKDCVTREDARVTAGAFTSVAAPGTPCIFGLDHRDEGSHCIVLGQDYGSYGWCYTAKDRSSWGSCSESCPLSGSHMLLEKRIDSMSELIDDLLVKVKDGKDCRRRRRRKKGTTLLEKLKKVKIKTNTQ